MASLMNLVLRKGRSRFGNPLISEDELVAIAKVIDGHPLGACRAISYIFHVLSQTADKPAAIFLEIFDGADWEARKSFLNYKPQFGLSVMGAFEISLQRLRRHEDPTLGLLDPTMRLLELLAFISNRDEPLSFRDFLGIKRPWLDQFKSDLPDYDVFARGWTGQAEYLAKLEKVSIGVRPHMQCPLEIHPLWIECIQQRAGPVARLRWLRQILTLCHASFVRNEEETFSILRPLAKNSFLIASRFNIDDDVLVESDNDRNEIKEFIQQGEGTATPTLDTIDENVYHMHLDTN